ncbi:MAG: cell wall-active antibiotics response protein [Treponema sp.]|nr:cell wall-active antibiotics response protein [Treponema sp.]
MDKPLDLVQVINERKNKLAEKLSSQYSLNYISLEEYERLVEYSQKIETSKELNILEKIVAANGPAETHYAQTSQKRSIKAENAEKDFFTLLSSRKTTGPISSGTVVNILGDHRIYLDEEDLVDEETSIDISVLLGSVTIHVQESVIVDCKALPILGEVSVKKGISNNGYGKKLKIRGSVILGELTIKPK